MWKEEIEKLEKLVEILTKEKEYYSDKSPSIADSLQATIDNANATIKVLRQR